VLRRRASVAGLLVLKIGLLAIVLLHLLSPKEKAPPVRTELFFSTLKFRISCSENKSANFLCLSGRVSCSKSAVITLDFSTKA
jgi:hypothetical protein